MCAGCGFPAAAGPWTDAGAADAGGRLRARQLRLALLARILRPHGLRVEDPGAVAGLVLARMTGERVAVPDLPALWAEAERMLGRPVDPLAFADDG